MAFKRAFRRRFAVVKEATPGVDPTTGYVIIPLNKGAETKMEAETVERTVLDDEYGSFGSVVVGKRWMLTGQMEGVAAGHVAGVINEPRLSLPLQACAMVKANAVRVTTGAITGTFKLGETVTTDTGVTIGVLIDIETGATNVFYIAAADHVAWNSGDVITGVTSAATATASANGLDALIYYPTSIEADMATLTVHDYEDGRRKVGTYVRGNCSINTNVNEFTTFDFDLTGLYSEPTDTALITGTVLCGTPPVNGAVVKIGSVDMTAIAVSAASLDFGLSVNPVADLQPADGFSAIDIGDAAPTGSITTTVPTLALFNPYALVAASTKVKIAWTVGTNQGERIRICVPNAQLSGVEEEEDNGIRRYTLPFVATKDCADEAQKFYIAIY
jgi:hypothetical protein